MYKIEGIFRGSSDDRVILKILTPDGKTETVSVSLMTYREMGIKKGEISEGLYDKIVNASLDEDALKKGLRVLSYGANSSKRLADKLVRSGVSRSRAEMTAEELKKRGYIMEDEDARRLAEEMLRRGWGERRILSSIRSKGYSAETVETVAEYLSEVDFVERCAQTVRKKFKCLPSDRAELQKAIAKLVNLGYNVNDAKKALAEVMSEQKK